MKIGFIGSGNMANAIIAGAINSQYIKNEDIFVSDINSQSLNSTVNHYCVNPIESNIELVNNCDIIFLSIKPNIIPDVINSLNNIKEKKHFISIAPSIDNYKLNKYFSNENAKVLRISPNTPLLAGEGMSVFCKENNFDKIIFDWTFNLFKNLGKVLILSEEKFDAVVAISGSSPAYVYMFIEAMADGGVLLGLSRDDSYTLAAQTVLGAAKMVLDTHKHPGELKDAVCSPGGTTIEAVASLENDGFRSSVINCMVACNEKIQKMKDK